MASLILVFPFGNSTSTLDSHSAVVLLTTLKRPTCVLISYRYFTIMVGWLPLSRDNVLISVLFASLSFLRALSAPFILMKGTSWCWLHHPG